MSLNMELIAYVFSWIGVIGLICLWSPVLYGICVWVKGGSFEVDIEEDYEEDEYTYTDWASSNCEKWEIVQTKRVTNKPLPVRYVGRLPPYFHSKKETRVIENTDILALLESIQTTERKVLLHTLYKELAVDASHSFQTMRTDYQALIRTYTDIDIEERTSQDESVLEGLRITLEKMEQLRRSLVDKSFTRVQKQLNIIKER